MTFRGTITNTGVITGGTDGINAGDNNTITNSGTIKGNGSYGISLEYDNTVTNSGNINGVNGVYVAGTGNTITNSGVISGSTYGVRSTQGVLPRGLDPGRPGFPGNRGGAGREPVARQIERGGRRRTGPESPGRTGNRPEIPRLQRDGHRRQTAVGGRLPGQGDDD